MITRNMLLVLRALEKGPKSFTMLKRELGLSGSSLDKALKELKRAGFITTDATRYYRPTVRGLLLLDVIDGPPSRLIEEFIKTRVAMKARRVWR